MPLLPRIHTVLLLLTVAACVEPLDDVSVDESALYGGTEVDPARYPQVGRIGFDILGQKRGVHCTATLIADDVVLTAAHCVCPRGAFACGAAPNGFFRMLQVPGVDDPMTRFDESRQLIDVEIAGTFVVHPDFRDKEHDGADRVGLDLAILHLNQPVSELTTVPPLPLIDRAPEEGEWMMLVGFGGAAGADGHCTLPDYQVEPKRVGLIKLDDIDDWGWQGHSLTFEDDDLHTCPGDSGGPAIATKGYIAGVASTSNFEDRSRHASTFHDSAWLRQQLVSPGNRHRMWIPDPTIPGFRYTYFDIDPEPEQLDFHAAGDLRFTGDFLGTGFAQEMLINNGSGKGRVLINDFTDNRSPAEIGYRESYGASPALNGWHQSEDSQLVGDFTGVGHDQLLAINRGGGPGRLAIFDFADGTVPAEFVHWTDAGDPAMVGWTDATDHAIAGDFCGLGHDQALFINNSGEGGRLKIVDFASGQPEICFAEQYGDRPLLDGWHDLHDRLIAGDFTGVGYDQLMLINTSGVGGKVLILGYKGGTFDPRYWENWGQSSLLDDWIDGEDALLAADFFGEGHDLLLAVNRSDAPGAGWGRMMLADFEDRAFPAELRFLQFANQDPRLETRVESDDGVHVGRFRSGPPQILTVERY